MAEDLTLRIPIEGDVSPISRALDTMKSKVANAMGQVRDALGAVGLMAAGFLVSAVKSAAASEVNFANLTQVIKSTGKAAGFSADQIKAMSKELSDQTTFTGGEIMKGQNMLLTFTGIQGDVLKRASMAMLDMSQKYGTKPEAQAIALGKALNDPIKGISALSRVGVVFTEQQKAQVKAMEDAGNMAGAQKIILDELSKEFGGQATAASKTYEGQIKQTTNSLNAAKTAIGTALMPALATMASKLNVVAGNIQDFTDKHKKLVAGILVAVAVIGTMVGGLGIFSKITSILGPAISGITALIGGMGLPIIAVIAGIAALALAYTKNLGGLKTFIDGTIGKAIAVIKGFAAAWNESGKGVFDSIGTLFGKNSTAVRIALWGITDGIKVFIAILTGNFKKATDILGEWSGDADEKTGNVVKAVARVALKIQQVIAQVIALAKAELPKIQQIIQQVFAQIKVIWETILKPVLAILLDVMKILVLWIIAHWPDIQKAIKAVIDVVVAIFNNVLVPALKFVMNAFSGVVAWVITNWPLIKNTITTVLNAVWIVIKSVLGAIQSFWNTWGKTIMDIVSICFNTVKIIISTAINVVENVIKAVMQAINGDWKGAWNSLIAAVRAIFGGLGAIIRNVLSGIGAIFGDIVHVAVQWGSNMIDGFIRGITGGIQRVKNAVGDVMKGVKGFLGFNSPSKEGEGQHITEWGANMVTGFMAGIKNKLPAMQDLMKTVIQAPSLDANVNMNLASGYSGVNNGVATNNNTTINFNGSYSFTNKDDIDTFMNKAALIVQRRKS